jgi:Holliday junction DNA helicase RuvB
MSKSAEEMLYLAMEDYRIDIMVGKGPGATSVPLELEPFTLIGATTRSGLLANPLRDRFGFTANLEFYSEDELVAVIMRASRKLGIALSETGSSAIAVRSRGTPRIANRLLRRVRDFGLVEGHESIDENVARAALKLFEVDDFGLDRLDRDVLHLLCTQYAGRAVGISTIAVAVGEEQDTIESVVEPYLVRTGLVSRTAKGREATQKAYQHLGLKALTNGQTPLFDL